MKKESLKVNFIYQSFYRILTLIMPIITSPYIARVLGAEGTGIYSFSFSIVSYFLLVAKLGIENYGNRAIAEVRDDQNKLNQAFSNIFCLHAIVSVIVLLAYLGFCTTVKNNRTIFLIQSIYLIAQIFDINWFYFGIEKFKITVLRNSVVKIGTVAFVFLFVKSSSDTWKYTLILSAGAALSESIVWMFLKKYARIVRPEINQFKSILLSLLVLFIPTVAISVYKVMDKIMLGLISNMTQVGYYENSEKIISICIGFISALGTVMLPRSANLIASGDIAENKKLIKKTAEIAFLGAYAMCFGIIGVSQVFPTIFWGNEFISCNSLLWGLALTLPFTSIANVIRTQYLIARKMDKEYIMSVVSGAIVNLIVNFIFIPLFSAFGAVIGTICAEATVCFIQIKYVKKEIPVFEYIKDSVGYLISGIIMALIVIFVGKMLGTTLLTLILQILTGGLIYVVLSYLYMRYKKSDALVYTNKILNRIRIRNKV